MLSQGPPKGGVQTGWASRSGLVLPFCPFLSFLGLSRFFWDFPDLLGDGPGISPICPFPLYRPIKSTYEEHSRKGPRHNLDLSWKNGKPPGLESPQFSFSQLSRFCIVKWKRGFRYSIWWSTRWDSQLSSSRLGRSLKKLTNPQWIGGPHEI